MSNADAWRGVVRETADAFPGQVSTGMVDAVLRALLRAGYRIRAGDWNITPGDVEDAWIARQACVINIWLSPAATDARKG